MDKSSKQLLSEKSLRLLNDLAKRLHQSPTLVLDEAISNYATRTDLTPEEEVPDWKERLIQAEGLWKDRTDLPDFDELRKSWDRNVWAREDDK